MGTSDPVRSLEPRSCPFLPYPRLLVPLEKMFADTVVDVLASAKGGSSHITPAVITTAFHLQASKYFQLASAIMLFYDELLTIGQEVERIWLQPWTGATLLFALIRYFSLLSRPIVLVAFFDPAWTKDIVACNRFVKFSGASTVVIVGFAQIIMILRVWALWRKDRRILYILGFFFVVQVAFVAMALVYSKRVPLPPFLVGCILTGSSNLHTPTWLMPLFTDTAIFALTILRVIRYSKEAKMGPNSVLRTFVRDGVLYYFCVFSSNLLNTLLYIFATEDLKAIGAGFSQCITTVVITRLVLNLRSVHKCHSMLMEDTQPYSKQSPHSHKLSRLDFVVGSLGDLPDYNDDDPEHDCNNTSSHVSSDGSQTVVSASARRLSYKSDLEKVQTNKAIDKSSPVSPGGPYPDKDIYRHSYRIVQHPYSLRAGFGGSHYVDEAPGSVSRY